MTDEQREQLISEYMQLLISAQTRKAKYMYLNLLTDLVKNRSQKQIDKMESMFK